MGSITAMCLSKKNYIYNNLYKIFILFIQIKLIKACYINEDDWLDEYV